MRRLIITFAVSLFYSILNVDIKAQSCTGLDIGTVGSSPTCLDFDAATPGSGSSVCAGGGHGGSGQVRIVRFCTGSTVQCVQFVLNGLDASNGISYALYTGCSGGTLSGYVSGSAACDGNTSTSVYTTAGLTLAPNTCYFLRVWTKNAPTSSAEVCVNTNPATNDYCTGATAISTTPQNSTNYCMTAGSNGSYTEPPPSQFCAGSLENNAWYSFTTSLTCTSPCTVDMYITGITCVGGAAGFQIGFWSGSCSGLSYLGCTSGSGGSVTATITGLSPGQQVIVGIDGNAGANCSYTISATNTEPLPISLIELKAKNTNNSNLIEWSTATETNNDFFTLEKSFDGNNFDFFQNIKGAGTSNITNFYKITDDKPFEGVTYYRLKQTDYDGNFEYLGTIAVKAEKTIENTSIIPNPVLNNAEINFNSSINGTGKIQIIDMTGKVIFNESINLNEGSNKFLFNTSNLSKGIYFMMILNDFDNEKLKFVKE
ncbi:MAG: T9SS type A sorting domain-containing protein [Bacteroidia bacterium]